jgi:viologen exporter family transport system permease protein
VPRDDVVLDDEDGEHPPAVLAMYPGWLRYSLTFIVPIAFAITVPAEAVIGKAAWPAVWLTVLVSIGCFIGSRSLFYVGIRKYTSANS